MSSSFLLLKVFSLCLRRFPSLRRGGDQRICCTHLHRLYEHVKFMQSCPAYCFAALEPASQLRDVIYLFCWWIRPLPFGAFGHCHSEWITCQNDLSVNYDTATVQILTFGFWSLSCVISKVMWQVAESKHGSIRPMKAAPCEWNTNQLPQVATK